jgi:hypothetical protein
MFEAATYCIEVIIGGEIAVLYQGADILFKAD